MRVLIVEDNMRLAESIRDILKHWYDCDICGEMCIRDSFSPSTSSGIKMSSEEA